MLAGREVAYPICQSNHANHPAEQLDRGEEWVGPGSERQAVEDLGRSPGKTGLRQEGKAGEGPPFPPSPSAELTQQLG